MRYHIGSTPGQLALPEDAGTYFMRFDDASDALGDRLDIAKRKDSAAHATIRGADAQGRIEGGMPCPRAGWWVTPAKTKSRRYFEIGELMPVIEDSDYGSTFWQWDVDQSVPKL